jgi:hypothetical protein
MSQNLSTKKTPDVQVRQQDHILKRLDLLSNISLVYFNKSDSKKSKLNYVIYVFLSSFLLFISVSIGLNYFNSKNYVSNYSVSPIINYKYDKETNVVDENLTRLRLKRSVYETFKLVKVDYDYSKTNIFVKLNYHECSIEELKSVFEIYEYKTDYIDICIKYADLLSDFFNKTVLDHEIHLVKCSDNLDIFKENECKNLVLPDEVIDLEYEMQILGNERKIKKGKVQNSDKLIDKGFFDVLLTLKTVSEKDKKTTFLDVFKLGYRYEQILNGRKDSIFSIYLKIGKNHHINEYLAKNILTFINIIMSYFQILKYTIIIALSWPLEYIYLQQ